MSKTELALEHTSFKVPLDCGYLIGNTLRQFAIRGTPSWQPAAYTIAPKEGSFGLGGDYAFSYLEFYHGRMLYFDDKPPVHEKMCKFEKQGEDYVCGDMVIVGLGKLGAPSMDVCLVYARGSRSQEQNYAVAERLIQQDIKNLVTVPSKHTPTVQFKFKVEPYDLQSEMLEIDATPGSVSMAREQAMSTLGGLNIEVQ